MPTLFGGLFAATGAVMLPASLFMDWYELRGTYPDGADIDRIGVNGWAIFEIVDLILILISITTLVMLLWSRGRWRRWLLPGLGAVAVVLVGFELLDTPPQIQFYADITGGFDSGVEAGGWLALGGGVLVVIGGLLSDASVRRSTHASSRESADAN